MWCTYSAGMASAKWNCCRLGASSVDTIQPCTMSLHAKPHTKGVCVFSCNLPPALLAEWPGSFMCYCSNTGPGGTDTEIGVNTESWLWRIKFSRRSCRDPNPRPFNHESGALTTELYPSHGGGSSSYDLQRLVPNVIMFFSGCLLSPSAVRSLR